MQGARDRHKRERFNVWHGAMLPHLKKPMSLQEFMAGEKDMKAEMQKCIAAWEKIDRALGGK